MKKESPTHQIQYDKLYMSVRYKAILFPFKIRELAQILPEIGFIVRDELVSPPPFGASISVSGPVAHKGDVRLSVNMDRMYMGIDAPDVETLMSEMNTIEDLLLDRTGFDSQKSVLFYELLLEATVRTDCNPTEVLGGKFARQSLFKSLSTIIGEPSTNFGLRLVPINAIPNQSDWHDVRIEPLVARAATHYRVSIVFRSAERSKVMGFASRLAGMLDNILLELEGE